MAINDSDLFVVGTNNGRQAKSATGTQLKEFLEPEFVNVSGDTMAGELNVQYPTADDNASSKEYVDGEIFKIQNQLDDLGSNLSNGSFQLKNPLSFSPPGSGEVLLVNSSNNTTLTVADVVMIAISHTNREGETQMFDDVENGYIQLKPANSSDEATFTVSGVAFSNASYSQLLVSYHAGNKPVLTNNSINYVNTIHIDGIDLDDLEQELDSRYVKLVGNSEIIGDIGIGTSPGSMNITLSKSGEVVADSFEGDGSKLENLPAQEVVHFGPEPADPIVGDLWWTDKTTQDHFELYVYAEYVDKDTGTPFYDWFAVTTHERFPSTFVSATAPPIEYFKKGDLWLDENTQELYCLSTVPKGPPRPYDFVFQSLAHSQYEIRFSDSERDNMIVMMNVIGADWTLIHRGAITATGLVSGVEGYTDWFFDYSQYLGLVAAEMKVKPGSTGFLVDEPVRFTLSDGTDWPIDPDTTRSTTLDWLLVSGDGDFMPLDLTTLPELPTP